MTRKEALNLLNETVVTPDLHPGKVGLWFEALELAMDALYTLDEAVESYIYRVCERAYEQGKQDALRGYSSES